MNTNTEGVAAQQPSRGNARGRGRGGGGRGASRATNATKPAKPAGAKVGPTRLLETEWVKDKSLGDMSFVVAGLSGKPGDSQWTFHRPIGETPLNERQWVATPTRDTQFLLQRKESEALAAWKRKAELAKRQQVLADRKGRSTGPDLCTEVWTFDGAPAIQPTIRSCMTAAKAAGAPESSWLDYADPAVQSSERIFKQALSQEKVNAAWTAGNPRPEHETMGGPLGDQPQKAVGYLNGLSLASARDKVMRVAIGFDKADDLDLSDEEESEDEDEEDDPPQSSSQTNKPFGGSPLADAVKAATVKTTGTTGGTKDKSAKSTRS